MDDLLLQYHNLVNDGEEMGFLDNEEDVRMLAATLIAGIELARLDCVETWNPKRLYLCCAHLLPDPHQNTPWQVLYASHNDHVFITIMGIDVLTFKFILTSGFASLWYHKSITHPDTNLQGIPHLNSHSLDAGGALSLVLHYLNSTIHETSLQQIFALIPATRCSALIVAHHSRLEGAFRSIDGLILPVQTSHDVDIENATYNSWLSKHFVSSVIAFSAEGIVIVARTNAFGSWHDSHLTSHIYTKLCLDTPPGYYIVADTAFPHGTTSIDGRICTPLKHGQVLCGSAAEIEEHMVFNCQLLSYCQTAEWGMRAIQGAFGRLHMPLDITNQEAHSNLIEICLRLHNLHAVCVGINQIWTVYMKHWQATKDDLDVWKKDWVLCFHVILEYQ
ncbi:hypothetical protein BDR06DRAFT_984583 [Suillus hirtellus]|nr:hypothetical protein BDR06DRAFT_984583 [Suillus hirtellus]